MIEQKDRISQSVECPPDLDYRKTLVLAGRKLQPLNLNRQEKTQLLIAVSDAFFPERASELIAHTSISNNEYKASVDSVFGSPKLFITFANLVSQLTDNAGQPDIGPTKKTVTNPIIDIHYENTWQKTPARQEGESERRFLAILNEHKSRYINVPVNLSRVAVTMGGVSRTLTCKLWNRLEEQKRIPEGITKQPARYRPPKKSA